MGTEVSYFNTYQQYFWYFHVESVCFTAGVQCIPERLQDLHKHGIR